jgi:hypothetical protein
MKKLVLAVITLALLILPLTSGCGGGGDNPFSGLTGAVRGVVVDEGNGKGIEGVSVVCGQDSALTNNKGEFEIDKSDAGVEIITAAKADYMGIGNDTMQVTVIENQVTNVGILKLAKLTGGSVNLTDLSPIAYNDFRTGSATFLNQVYPSTIFGSSPMADNDAVVVYIINGRFTEFKATVGVNDTTPYKSETYKFLCFIDGVKVSEIDGTHGQISQMNVNVSGATEIRLEIRCFDSAAGRAGANDAGFGDARLIP